ncbi:MAG: ribonuclease H-like domain-containing protein [Candidatus Doudnabacteria bacterium]|nr:ribonuclease H-like domain-containing protein [Candidatus Doudnabacteria bacterium]
MLNKIVLDIETQRDFAEVGGRNKHHLLKVSVAGIYSYPDDQYQVFEERELLKLGELLGQADQIIGFNVRQFDYEVLKPYFNFSLNEIPTLDILEEIEKMLGHRIGLEAVASATLGAGKSGTGINAIRLWKTGQIDELKKYCLSDVKLTRGIYEYGLKYGRLLYQDFFETRELPVEFTEPEPRKNVVRQASLF